MMSKQDVTIIIPAHNEEEGIADAINGIKRLNVGYEIIVVDDGSTDNTYKLASETGVKIIRHPYNKGYGAALKTGIRNAEADVVLFMDADGQHKPSDIQKLLQYIREEYDMVVGARTKKSKISLLRRPGKKVLSITANYLAGVKIPDLNSGFRALKKSVVLEFMHILPNSFSFSTTITLALITSGYSVKYVPIEAPERVGTSKIKPFRDGFRFILMIVRTIALFNPLKIFLPVSLLLFLSGVSYLIYEVIVYVDISDTSLLLIISSLLIFFFGVLSDQVSVLIRGRER
jgi:glycosyltransferase involved in cell wall biosynthesis